MTCSPFVPDYQLALFTLWSFPNQFATRMGLSPSRWCAAGQI